MPDGSKTILHLSQQTHAHGKQGWGAAQAAYTRLDCIEDALGNKAQFAYTIDSGEFTCGAQYNEIENYSLLLTSITYPTGAQTSYTYTGHEEKLGEDGGYTVFKTTVRQDSDSTQLYNNLRFTYNGKFSNSSGNYNTIIARPDGICVQYTFNAKHLNTRTGTFNGTPQAGPRMSLVTKAYNSSGLPTTVTTTFYNESGDARSFVERFTYDNFGNLTSYTDPENHIIEYSYFTRYPSLNTMPVNQDLLSMLTGKTWQQDENTAVREEYVLSEDKLSLIAKNVYANNVLQQKTEYAYDAFGNITSEKQYLADMLSFLETQYSYTDGAHCAQARISGVLDADGNPAAATPGEASGTIALRMEYDDMGRLSKRTDGRGYETTYEYDALGNLTQLCYPDGACVSYARNYTDNTVIVTDTLGTAICYRYNAVGLESAVIDAASGKTLSAKTYDAMLRQASQSLYTESGLLSRTVYAYDWNGRITGLSTYDNAAETGLVYQESYAYDDAAGGSVSPAVMEVRTGESYSLPNPVREGYIFAGWYLGGELVANGTTVLLSQDCTFVAHWDEEEQEPPPVQQTYSIVYDGGGGKIPGTNETTVTQQYEEGEAVNLLRNPFQKYSYAFICWLQEGTYKTYQDGQSNITDLVPDDEGIVRLTAMWMPTNPWSVQSTPYEAILRDADAYAQQHSGAEGMVTFALSQSDAEPSDVEEMAPVYLKTYTYDLSGNRMGFALSENQNSRLDMEYAYDALNRLTSVYSGGVLAASYGYDANGNRSFVEYANGLRTDYAYNAANQLTGLVNKNAAGDTLSSFSYTYTLDGNQTSRIDAAGRVTAYAYDGFGRLSSEEERLAGQILFQASYTYDDFGNRSMIEIGGLENYSVAYTYDLNNRLLTQTQTAGAESETYIYTYDASGNQLTKSLLGAAQAEETRTYNLSGQLASVTSGGSTFNYAYWPSGLRMYKACGTEKNNFVWDGANLVYESGSTTVYTRGTSLIAAQNDTDLSYYLFNGHGDVVQLADSAGVITQEYDYDAFGVEKNADTADANSFRYCGEYFDAETDTYYLRARYYAPELGRFTSEDTHWNPGNIIYGDEPVKWNEPVKLGNPLLENEQADTRNLNLNACTKNSPILTIIHQNGNYYIYAINNPLAQKDPSGKFIISTALLFIVGGVITLGAVGGVVGNSIAEQNGAAGWDKAAYIAVGVAIGAAVGAGVGYIASAAFTTITGITGISITAEGSIIVKSGLFVTSQINQMVSNIEPNRVNHIMQTKHAWELVNAGSWDGVSQIINTVLRKGTGVINNAETSYPSQRKMRMKKHIWEDDEFFEVKFSANSNVICAQVKSYTMLHYSEVR